MTVTLNHTIVHANDKEETAGFMSEILGLPPHKMPGHLLEIITRPYRSTRGATMVGDRRHDVLGARQYRMCAIGVTYGYGSRQELEEAGADEIVTAPAEVVR